MNDNTLNIKRGTTPTITMNIPENIDLTRVTDMWFSISQSGSTSEPLIKRDMFSCNVDAENHKVWVLLTQEETLRLMPTAREGIGYGNNVLALVELSIIYDNGVRTTTKKQTATILDNVREGVMAGNPLHATEPIDNLEIDVEFDTVINEAPMNYNDLQGKPSINGNVLVGNKTNAELGIATKVSELDNDLNFQENVIESISVNDTPVIVEDKNVNIEIPTTLSELENDAGYITEDDIPVKSISVNNETVTPDANKNVDITIDIPDVPVKSISVNTTPVQPDLLGNVDITVPVLPEEYLVRVTWDENEEYGNVTLDKTDEEILAVLIAGKKLVLDFNGYTFDHIKVCPQTVLLSNDDTMFQFTAEFCYYSGADYNYHHTFLFYSSYGSWNQCKEELESAPW